MSVELYYGAGVVGIMIVLSSYVSLFVERGHLLMVLLILEVTMLGIFSFLCLGLDFFNGEVYLCLVLISFAACEAAVGLALLVSLIRSHGNDFVSVLSIYEC
uniref:NADH-ubiquinone oxidoreductase chain 4L n=1 Tax=Micrura bella TaxID=1692167 RepID=A0A0U2EZN2_9BILA|nr:NADH dehydrogenase subunit 4L [Micrura bella]AKT74021.1 NADH dehydrogenase subunit 4L [Micrura bella]